MVDFKKALQDGLAADAIAEAGRKEIRSLIAEVSTQVSEATGGEVGVELGKNTRQKVRHLAGVVALAMGTEKEVTKIEYTALFAKRLVEPDGRSELAELEISPEGYPVLLIAPNVSSHAYDRASLEGSLEKLLKHPDTGGKIRTLLAMKPAAPPTT